MKIQVISTCFTALLLSSCGIYTKYERPDSLPLDSLYRDVDTSSQDTSSVASLSWRELFTDQQLIKLIEQALEQNTSLQTARLRVEEAQASLTMARRAFIPSLYFSPTGTLSNFDGESSKTYNVGLSTSWEVDAFGSLRNAKKGSQMALEQSKAYEQAVQTQLIATVAETYYSLVAIDKKILITEETVGKWEESVRTMRALKKAGQYNEAAVAQAEANLLSARTSLLALEQQRNKLENTLSTTLGMTPQAVDRSDLFELQFPTELSVGLPAQLLSRRPDVRQAEMQLAQAFYAENQARSAFYPNITLSGSAGWTNNAGTVIVNPGKLLLTAVGTLTQPIFAQGRNKANLKIAKAQQEEAKLSFTQALLDAGAEVNNALTQWQTAQQTLELDKQSIEALERAVLSTQRLMQHGTTNYLEVLTAQQTLLQTQLAAIDDKYSEIQGVISLYHSLGGGTD